MPESPVRSLYLGMNAKPWQGVEQVSTSQQHPLGTFFDDEFGRRYRYGLAGGVALTAGMIVSGATLGGATTTLQSVTIVNTAVAQGATRVLLTAITTAQAANLYDEGWASIWDNTITSVYTRRIKTSGPLSLTGAADLASCIDLYDSLPVALDTADRCALQVNPFKNIVANPAGRIGTGLPLGGVMCAVPLANYCWVQTKGMFGFRIKDATTNIQAGPVGPATTTLGTLVSCLEADTAAAYMATIGWSTALWLDEYSGIVNLMCE